MEKVTIPDSIKTEVIVEMELAIATWSIIANNLQEQVVEKVKDILKPFVYYRSHVFIDDYGRFYAAFANNADYLSAQKKLLPFILEANLAIHSFDTRAPLRAEYDMLWSLIELIKGNSLLGKQVRTKKDGERISLPVEQYLTNNIDMTDDSSYGFTLSYLEEQVKNNADYLKLVVQGADILSHLYKIYDLEYIPEQDKFTGVTREYE